MLVAALMAALAAEAPDERFAKTVRTVEALGRITLPSERDRADLEGAVLRLVGDYPQEPIAWYWQGDWSDRQRQPEAAAKAWEQALQKPGKLEAPAAAALTHGRCLRRLAYAKLAALDGAAAAALAKKGAEYAPHEPATYRCWFDASLRTGDLDEPLARLRAAAAAPGPTQAALRTLRHELLARTGAWATLREELDAVPPADRRAEDDAHFRALLAALAGNATEAAVWHMLADLGGPVDAPTVRASRKQVRKLRGAEPEQLPAGLRAYALALNNLDYRQDHAAAFAALEPLPRVETGPEPLLRGYLRARLAAALNRPDALDRWRALAERHPMFVPGLVGLGEQLEASDGAAAEAQRTLDAAAERGPMNWKVREHRRMGATLRPHRQGVEILAVAAESAWARFGAKAGDVLTGLDAKPLAPLPVLERMQFARLFAGGRVEISRPGAPKIDREMEIQLFDE